MTTAWIIACVGMLVFAAHSFVALFNRARIPDVLLLITIGILLGPVLGWVRPEHIGSVGPVFAQIALAIILFEGGHDTQLDVLRENWRSCLLLIFPAFLIAFLLGTAFLRHFTGLGYESCFLFGAILGSTSPSVVVPLVKQLRMRKGPALVLTMESALADVLCLVLVLGFLEAHAVGGIRISSMLIHIVTSFLIAGAIGAAVGLVWSSLLARIRAVQNNIFMTLALVFLLYGALDAVHLSGGVAALVFGMCVSNAARIRLPGLGRGLLAQAKPFSAREKAFFSEAVFLIKTFFFIYLGLSLRFSHWDVLLFALALVAAITVLRIPIVRLAMPRSVSRRDASVMAVLAPKGLAAAVLAALPAQQGWVGGEFIQELSYSLILFSILGSSVLVFLIETTPFGRFLGGLFAGFGGEERSGDVLPADRTGEQAALLEPLADPPANPDA